MSRLFPFSPRVQVDGCSTIAAPACCCEARHGRLAALAWSHKAPAASLRRPHRVRAVLRARTTLVASPSPQQLPRAGESHASLLRAGGRYDGRPRSSSCHGRGARASRLCTFFSRARASVLVSTKFDLWPVNQAPNVWRSKKYRTKLKFPKIKSTKNKSAEKFRVAHAGLELVPLLQHPPAPPASWLELTSSSVLLHQEGIHTLVFDFSLGTKGSRFQKGMEMPWCCEPATRWSASSAFVSPQRDQG